MKINKKSNTNMDITTNIQNNQRKEILSSIHKLGLRRVLLVHKRNIFTKGSGSIVLKKSGEIRINNNLDGDLIIKNTVSSPRLNLNLITPEINNLYNNKINLNQIVNFAQYNKVDINQIIGREVLDCKNASFTLINLIKHKKQLLFNLYTYGEVNKQYMLDYTRCSASFQRSLEGHNVVIDIIKQTNENITFVYYAITTSDRDVNYGAGNVFKTLQLFTNQHGKMLYFVPLRIEVTVEKEKYMNIFQIKSKEGYRETYQEQKAIIDKIIEYEKTQPQLFYRVSLDEFFNADNIRFIQYSNLFKSIDPNNITTPWQEFIYNS